MDSKRQIKYARQLQKDMAEIFQKDPNYYFKSALGTITHVSVSPDLGLVRIYLSIFPTEQAKSIFDHLNEIKSEIRHQLGNKIRKRVRIVPELAFFYDDTEEKATKIDKILNNLHIPPLKEE